MALRRATRDHHRDVTLAWNIAAMTVAAKVGKLKPLDTLLKAGVSQTAQDHLHALRVLSAQTGIPLQPSPGAVQGSA